MITAYKKKNKTVERDKFKGVGMLLKLKLI